MKLIYQKSIELLQKAEPLALRYSEKGFYLAFSGGKDSQALYHIAKMAGVKFEAHMNFTSVDPPQVIRFVRENYPDVICHAPKKSIYQLAVEHGILPSMRIRWCCNVLKEGGGAGLVTLTGVRRAESARRKKRKEVEVSSHKFGGTLEVFGEWQSAQKALQIKNLNQDQFAEAKETEVRCVNGKDKIIINPILDWSAQDVWDFLNKVVKVPHCCLYDMGYRRIGCICCPMSGRNQKIREIRTFPHVKRNWLKAIKAIREGGGISQHLYSQQHGRGVTQVLSSGDCSPMEKSKYGDMGGWILDHNPNLGFSDSLVGDDRIGSEATENEIAERIFDWWISGKSYKKWYADTFLQLKIPFVFDE